MKVCSLLYLVTMFIREECSICYCLETHCSPLISMICCYRRQVGLLPCTLSVSLANQCTSRRDKRRLCPSFGLSLPGSKARPLPGRTLPSPLPPRWTLLVKRKHHVFFFPCRVSFYLCFLFYSLKW